MGDVPRRMPCGRGCRPAQEGALGTASIPDEGTYATGSSTEDLGDTPIFVALSIYIYVAVVIVVVV